MSNHQNVNIAETLRNLESRNFNTIHCPDSSSAGEAILAMLPPESKISWGGSHTLSDIGLFEKLRQKPFVLYDRSTAKQSRKRTKYMPKYKHVIIFLLV